MVNAPLWSGKGALFCEKRTVQLPLPNQKEAIVMRRRTTQRGLWIGWPLIALAALAAASPAVVAAERVVLGEEFSATW